MPHKQRCPWLDLSKADYVDYHDREWGVPVYDDQKMFEFLTLESAQAGLSWYTVLKKRENYRSAFNQFNALKMAEYGDRDVDRLMQNSGIIRNRLKISAAINNARCFLEIQSREGSFANFLWQFVDGQPIVGERYSLEDFPATTNESQKMSMELKRLGFKFVGPTICYAHMQASGMVNDHLMDCFRRNEILADN